MKKILISLICFLSVCLSVWASNYRVFPYDTNLILDTESYQKLNDGYYGCFGYINFNKVKLQGRAFMSEMSCVKFNRNTGDILISEKSTFNYTDDNFNTYKITAKPYYFENAKIQGDIVDFFLAIENGGFSDRD